MDLDTMWVRFEREYLELNSISAKRRAEQLVVLRHLVASLDGDLATVTAADIMGFIGTELAGGLHPNTGRKHAAMIRTFVGWAESADLMLTGQRQLIRNPRGSTARSTPKPYKPSEIVALRAALADRYPMVPLHGRGSRELRLFTNGTVGYLRRSTWRQAKRLQLEAQIALALEQGLRRIEILTASMEAIHPDNAHIAVRTAKQAPGSDARRLVPYTTHARRCMEEWLDFRYIIGVDHDHPWLLLCTTGDKAAQTQQQTLRAFAGSLEPLEGHWNWHRLRHTAATEWLRARMPLEKVRVMMGHATIEQTLAYTHISADDMEEAVHDAEARFNGRLGLGSVAA